MSILIKKLFRHGGSYAIDIPMPFAKHADTKEIIIETHDDELILRPKTELDTIESEPQFSKFITALAADAMKHPEKLRGVKEVWDKEWDVLLKGVSDDGK